MLNKVILMGRLTTDPETMVIGESNVKASFVIAVPRNYKPKGSQEVDFIKINAWNKIHISNFAVEMFNPNTKFNIMKTKIYNLITPEDYHITPEGMYWALISLKLSRQHYNHKEDNLLDAVAYMGALNNYIESKSENTTNNNNNFEPKDE